MPEQANTKNFHGDEIANTPAEEALFHVIPVPYEESVSYGTGTAQGPQAIIEASCQLETLTCGMDPSKYGIHTDTPVDCSGSAEQVLQRIADKVSRVKNIPVILGGEHTVTLGAIQALQQRYDTFGIVQFDAHADLRASYEGSKFSHACVMRRIHELGIPMVQLGTRSYSHEEQQFRAEHKIPYFDSEQIWKAFPTQILPDNFPKQIYITFDIDGLDASVMPTTGTPVPGGLSWYQAMWLVETVMQNRTCIGLDVVEFAPIEQLHACNFTAAQLVYNLMAYCGKKYPD